MPGVLTPNEQWLSAQIATLKQQAAALQATSTQYVIPPGSTQAQAIIGNIATDQAGNSTGLSGWGVAIWNGTAWVSVGAGFADSGWQNVTYQNSWTTGPSGLTNYRKIGSQVFLRGDVTPGSSGTVVFTLATGYRPVLAQGLLGQGQGAGEAVADVDIATSGTVTVFYGAGVTSVSLNGISFFTN